MFSGFSVWYTHKDTEWAHIESLNMTHFNSYWSSLYYVGTETAKSSMVWMFSWFLMLYKFLKLLGLKAFKFYLFIQDVIFK